MRKTNYWGTEKARHVRKISENVSRVAGLQSSVTVWSVAHFQAKNNAESRRTLRRAEKCEPAALVIAGRSLPSFCSAAILAAILVLAQR
jgi:hypothetical protein